MFTLFDLFLCLNTSLGISILLQNFLTVLCVFYVYILFTCVLSCPDVINDDDDGDVLHTNSVHSVRLSVVGLIHCVIATRWAEW